MGRPKAKAAREAWDAGVDYARDLTAWHPDWDADQCERELEGCCMDLVGGDEVAADWACDGGRDAIRKHFAKGNEHGKAK